MVAPFVMFLVGVFDLMFKQTLKKGRGQGS